MNMRRPHSKGVNSGLTKCQGNTHLCTEKWEIKSNKDVTLNKSCTVLMHPYMCIYIGRVLQHDIKHAVQDMYMFL